MSNKPQAETQAPPNPSLWQRVIQIFWAPNQLFKQLRAHPQWGGALLVVLALETLAGWAISETALQTRAAASQADVEFLKTMRYIVPLFTALVTVIWAGMVMFAGNVVLGGRPASRKRCLSVLTQ